MITNIFENISEYIKYKECKIPVLLLNKSSFFFKLQQKN